MSNAKWRALYDALRAAGIRTVRLKFVRDARIFEQTVPEHGEPQGERFTDTMPAPYAPLREIEWLEIPMAAFAQLHSSHKHFPWHPAGAHMRLIAYSW